jgi:hypothetical protein
MMMRMRVIARGVGGMIGIARGGGMTIMTAKEGETEIAKTTGVATNTTTTVTGGARSAGIGPRTAPDVTEAEVHATTSGAIATAVEAETPKTDGVGETGVGVETTRTGGDEGKREITMTSAMSAGGEIEMTGAHEDKIWSL